MRRILTALIVLALTGCFEEQKRQVAKCELDPTARYPGKTLGISNDIGGYIQLCMRAAGYDWNLMDKRCPAGSFTIERVPYCYVPSGWLGHLGYNIEMAFE